MSGPTQPVGQVVSRGVLRVDARRAVAKLREHLLVDRHDYLLEVVRSAVAGGATRIDARCDADDVELTWDGTAAAPGALVHLLDHVLGAPSTAEGRRLRLLASGVNAALGLGPAFVDLYTVGQGEPRGGCTRLRWTPAMLEAEAEGGLPRPEAVPPPSGLPSRGLRLHVRRRLGWAVVRAAVLGSLPREIAALAAATHDLPVPLALGGEPFPRPARPAAIARVAFAIEGATRAVLELTEPGPEPAWLDVAEQGVRLVRYAWEPPWGLASPSGGAALPVRVLCDAPELPTNASRSEIREDARLLAELREGSARAFEMAVRALGAWVTGAGEADGRAERLSDDDATLDGALGLFVAAAAAVHRRRQELGELGRWLLELPLLRDGCGRPRPAGSLLSAPEPRVFLWQGPEPIDPELAPWMRDVVWKQGRLVERALGGSRLADAGEVVALARRGLERKRRFLAHPAGPVVLPESQAHLVRERFRLEHGRLAGLEGEVAVLDPAAAARGAEARVFVQGRQLACLPLEPSLVPLPLEIALAWEGKLSVRFGFDGIEDDAALREALWAGAQIGVMAVGRLVEKIEQGKDEREAARLRTVLRAAVATAFVSPRAFGLDSDDVAGLGAAHPLRSVKLWRTTEHGRWASLQELGVYAARTGALCVAGPRARGGARDGRPVVAADRTELGLLQAALGAKVQLVPYEWALQERPSWWDEKTKVASAARAIQDGKMPAWAGGEKRERLAGLRQALDKRLGLPADEPGDLPTLRLEAAGMLALLAPRAAGLAEIVDLHAGRELRARRFPPRFGPCVAVVDDDRIVPNADGSGVVWRPASGLLPDFQRELLGAIVAHSTGEGADARLSGLPPAGARSSPLLQSYLLSSAAALRRAREGKANRGRVELRERLWAMPLLVVLDERGEPETLSIARVEELHPAPAEVPVVERPVGQEALGFATMAWRPIVVSKAEQLGVLRACFGERVRDASAEIPARQREAELEARRQALLATEPLDTSAAGPYAAEGALVACCRDDATGMSAAVALPRRVFADGRAHVEVLYEGRRLCEHSLDPGGELPVAARVNLTWPAHVSEWRCLSEAGRAAGLDLLKRAAIDLAVALVTRAHGLGNSARLFGDLAALQLVRAMLGRRPLALGIEAALRHAELLWPTVQGPGQKLDAILRIERALCFGDTAYAWAPPVRQPSQLDQPILHLPSSPEGEAAKAVLAARDQELRDVSAAVEKLQRGRAARQGPAAPRLPGEPLHPALRASLADLGAVGCEGEIEIVEGPGSDVRMVDLGGKEQAVDGAAPCPLRAVARIEALATVESATRVAVEIRAAAQRHLASLGDRLGELPDFVRAHLREQLLAGLAAGGPSPDEARAALFEDTAGRLHSLDGLRAAIDQGTVKNWLFTWASPPYPARGFGKAMLRLRQEDAALLRAAVPLFDATLTLKRQLEAERRASAPPVDRIGIPAKILAKCLQTTKLAEPGLEGEVGFLAPEHAGLREAAVFKGRRPLCTMADGEGWPLVAAVEDDALEPSPFFDGPRVSAQAHALREKLRRAVDAELARWLAAPEDAVAVVRFDAKGLDVAGVHVPAPPSLLVAGALWLPALWPESPLVRVRGLGRTAAEHLPLCAGSARPGWEAALRPVPIEGDLLVKAASAVALTQQERLGQLGRWALDVAAAMLSELDPSRLPPAELDAYRWDLWLLGQGRGAPPRAECCDRPPVLPGEVLLELERRGEIWWSEARGVADGAFPDGAPGFVLQGGSPLLRVLRGRGYPVRELGKLEARRVAAPARAPASAAPAIELAVPERALVPPPAAAAPSWWQGLASRAVAVLRDEPEAQPAEADALLRELRSAVGRLELTGDPVAKVAYAKGGRAVRYEPKERRLVLARSHPLVARLAASEPLDPRALALLVAAAVSEVNRALVAVTDDEEQRVLLALLGSRPGG
ncbi:MAG: hypothetical protein HY744_12170 [Deltaproteobacteria bacterium]|nr:hypothetical protein [Deltaproteobacteria bacterium]